MGVAVLLLFYCRRRRRRRRRGCRLPDPLSN